MNEAAATVGLGRWQSDERLTRRACGGDERAFAVIFRRYHQPLYRFCLAIVGNPEDAQDALQNTMVKVMRALPGEERKIELKPWLYRIAHNESVDLLRRRRETRQLDAEQAAPGYGLAEDAATRERLRRLLIDLRELPERQRETLVMRELAGLGFEEIGAALGTSDAVARQTLYEARQSLRQMEAGREMSCDEVTRALSDGDGRVTRRRDVRAHLRSCADCRVFRDEIKGRQHDLAAISPLPAAAVAGILQGLAGGSGAASSGGVAAALGSGAAQTISASAAAKGVATVAVAAAVGAGAADRTGIIHLGLPGKGNSQPAKSAPATPGAMDEHAAPGHGVGAPGHGAAGNPGSKGNGRGQANHGAPGSAGKKAGHGAASRGSGPPPHAKEHSQQHNDTPAAAKSPGPPAEHPSQAGEEKQQPDHAAGGQEAATERKPQTPEPGGGEEATPPQPQAAPGPPAKELSPNPPPAAAPESSDQAPSQPGQAPASQTSGQAAPAPAPSSGGKGSEAEA
jgi:RNA polymerase sigma factor (sigma-70 family)